MPRTINNRDWDRLNRTQDDINNMLLRQRMTEWQQRQAQAKNDLERRMQDIRERQYSEQSEDRRAKIAADAKAKADETARKTAAQEGNLNINRQKLEQNAKLQAQKADQWEQNFNRLDDAGKAKELQAFVTGVQKSVDSASKYGVDDTTAQSITDGMSQWTPEQESAVRRGAPVAYAKLKQAQRVVDGGRNPFPLPIPASPSEPTAVAYKKNFDAAVQNGDDEGAKYYQALMAHVSGQDQAGATKTTEGIAKATAAKLQLQKTVDDLTAKLQTLPAGSPEALAAQKALGTARQGLNQMQASPTAAPAKVTPPAQPAPKTDITPPDDSAQTNQPPTSDTNPPSGGGSPLSRDLVSDNVPPFGSDATDAANQIPAASQVLQPTASPTQVAPPAAAPTAPPGRVKVRHKVSGQTGSVPADQLPLAIQNGYEPLTPPPAQ